jgi:CRP-like cAMP-binding protein
MKKVMEMKDEDRQRLIEERKKRPMVQIVLNEAGEEVVEEIEIDVVQEMFPNYKRILVLDAPCIVGDIHQVEHYIKFDIALLFYERLCSDPDVLIAAQTDCVMAFLIHSEFLKVMSKYERKDCEEITDYLGKLNGSTFTMKRSNSFLAHFVREVQFIKNSFIFREGEPVDFVYMIKEGEIEAIKAKLVALDGNAFAKAVHSRLKVGILGPYNVIGDEDIDEVPAGIQRRRDCTTRAISLHVRCYRVPSRIYQKFINGIEDLLRTSKTKKGYRTRQMASFMDLNYIIDESEREREQNLKRQYKKLHIPPKIPDSVSLSSKERIIGAHKKETVEMMNYISPQLPEIKSPKISRHVSDFPALEALLQIKHEKKRSNEGIIWEHIDFGAGFDMETAKIREVLTDVRAKVQGYLKARFGIVRDLKSPRAEGSLSPRKLPKIPNSPVSLRHHVPSEILGIKIKHVEEDNKYVRLAKAKHKFIKLT